MGAYSRLSAYLNKYSRNFVTKLRRLVLTVVPEPMTSFKLSIPMIAAERFFFLRCCLLYCRSGCSCFCVGE